MKISHYALVISFLVVIFGFGIVSKLQTDRPSSVFENRTLSQEPVKDLSLIRSGEFFKQYETYFSDQFLLRDKWVGLYTKLQVLSPKTFVNGYYIGKNGWIYNQPAIYTPEDDLKKSAEALNELGKTLSESGTKLYYFPVPSKTNMTQKDLPKYLPEGVGEKNKQYLLSHLDRTVVNYEDFRPEYEKDGYETVKSYYYKTDHHWNEKGGFLAYKLITKRIHKDYEAVSSDVKKSDYEHKCYNGYPFSGSFNRMVFNQVSLYADTVCQYIPKTYSFKDYDVYRGAVSAENKVPYSNIYAEELVNKTGTFQYGSAFTWDLREFNIINKKSQNKLNVLILKDSYSNAAVFPLAHHFYKTSVFDMRYNREITASDYIKNNKFDMVIIFYNDGNIMGSMYEFDKLPQ
ncbi:hypothetical protein [Neobacillus sp. NPDC093127]|uniref:alginate O-acetyltransferase AlgX-related protein n=1 Tax=Neobacillus sp. NPDC093127 TaxID=3364296 RepID=UPI0038176B07